MPVRLAFRLRPRRVRASPPHRPEKSADSQLIAFISRLSDLWELLPESDGIQSWLLVQCLGCWLVGLKLVGLKEDVETSFGCVAAKGMVRTAAEIRWVTTHST
jgi:hypothetical protein